MTNDELKQVIICENDGAPEQAMSSAKGKLSKRDKPIIEENMPRCVELCDADGAPRCKRFGTSKGVSRQAQLRNADMVLM